MKVKTKLETKELVRMTIEETNNCYPINSEWTPIMSVRKQLNYILESLDFLNDRSRLSEINIGHQGLKAEKYAGYKGIAGFVANIAIGTFADKYENGLADETSERARILNISDAKNGINVIAINS